MKSLQRILAIVRKEVRQLRRDRLTFGMIVGIPVIQLLMFGYAINMDVRNLDAAVADLAGTSASRQMVMDLSHNVPWSWNRAPGCGPLRCMRIMCKLSQWDSSFTR